LFLCWKEETKGLHIKSVGQNKNGNSKMVGKKM